jgi:NADH-quinone oxidoreductase subunit F
VYELPLGYSMLKAIYDVAGGIPHGRKLKAVVPGGSSCPILKADECDIPMDYDTLAKVGSMVGSGGMVVMDETTDMVRVALRIMRFYAHESCGWCIPCREGTTWLKKILTRMVEGNGRREDVPLLGELSKNMLGRTFCALGDAAALPTISIVDKFAEDFEKYIVPEAVLV